MSCLSAESQLPVQDSAADQQRAAPGPVLGSGTTPPVASNASPVLRVTGASRATGERRTHIEQGGRGCDRKWKEREGAAGSRSLCLSFVSCRPTPNRHFLFGIAHVSKKTHNN